MKKIYQQWQLAVYEYAAQDVIRTSEEVEGTGYAWKRTDWNSVDDNPWN